MPASSSAASQNSSTSSTTAAERNPIMMTAQSLHQTLSKHWLAISTSTKKSTRTSLLMSLFAAVFAAHSLVLFLFSGQDPRLGFYPLMLATLVYTSRQYSTDLNSKSPESTFFELCAVLLVILPALVL